MARVDRILQLSILPGLAVAWAAMAALPPNFLDNSPILALNEVDKQLQRDALLFVLESPDARATREWKNPLTGCSGRIDGQGDLVSADRLPCRKVQLRTHAKGMQSSFAFPLCKDPQGNWFIASGMKFDE